MRMSDRSTSQGLEPDSVHSIFVDRVWKTVDDDRFLRLSVTLRQPTIESHGDGS